MGRGHGLISTWARWDGGSRWQPGGPAPPPPLPAEQMPGQQGGGLTGMGGHPHCGAASGGFLPASTPQSLPRGCQPAEDSQPPKDVLGSQRLRWAKVTAKTTTGAAFCTHWSTETSDTAVPRLLLPCPSAAGRTRHPCPSAFAAALRLFSKITRNGKPSLNPTSAARPSPRSVHGASRGIKG